MARRGDDGRQFLLSALELVTCLPPSPADGQRGSSVHVGTWVQSAVPAPLLFSPLAHSLARQAPSLARARSNENGAVRLLRAARGRVAEAAIATLDVSEAVVQAMKAHLLSTLQALNDVGYAARSLLALPEPPQVNDWRKGVAKKPSGLAFAAVLPGDGVAEIVIAQSVLNFLNIYNSVLIARLVLTWFPGAPQAIVQPLSTICDPYLNLFRGIIPPLGGSLDFSPILAFLVLNVFTNAAAAIPAEMPATESSKGKTILRSRK